MKQSTVAVPPIKGARIKSLRQMTHQEMTEMCWSSRSSRANPLVLELDNGITILVSSDDEGNSPGVLFGRYIHKDGARTEFYVTEES